MIGFVHINHTGGTTVKFILRNSFGLRHCDVISQARDRIFRDDELRFARRLFFGLRSISGHTLVQPGAHLSGDIRYFTFLRDPIVRTASHFQQVVVGRHGMRRKKWWKAGAPEGGGLEAPGKPSFEEFIANEKYRNYQVRRIAGAVDFDRAREEIERSYFFVGLTERYDESVRVLATLSPYPIDTRYMPMRIARDNTLKNELLADPRTRALIEDANEVDSRLYEWVRDEYYPEQRRRAGLSDNGAADSPGILEALPLSYRLNRLYTNSVYRPGLKLRKLCRRG